MDINELGEIDWECDCFLNEIVGEGGIIYSISLNCAGFVSRPLKFVRASGEQFRAFVVFD